MGLTIHYNLSVPENWTPTTIRGKLEALRQSCLDMPVEEVGELQEFKGDECDYEKSDDKDEYRWTKIQAQRHLESPWEPGTSFCQSPSHMVAFSVWPAQGCEEMNIGINSYPQFVRKPNRRDRPEQTWADIQCNKPAWSVCLERDSYLKSRSLLNAFAKKWNLRRLPFPKKDGYDHLRSQSLILHANHYNVRVVYGRYQSHRRGYAPSWVLVELDDRMKHQIRWRFRGTIEEAQTLFKTPEFKAEMERLVHGEKYVIPALKGHWRSFCKTQYANDPAVGGIKNFLRAHLSVCAILEKAQDLGFVVHVSDEGDFWTKRDVQALVEEVGEWDQQMAGMFGAINDALPEGMKGVTAMDGRPDFERLEFKAQSNPKIAELLNHLKKIVPQEVQ